MQTKTIDFPELHAGGRVVYPLVEAEQRGFKSTTGGDIIHEVLPNVPGDDWQGRIPNSDQGYSRVDQIREAMSINAAGIQSLFDRRLSQATTLDG